MLSCILLRLWWEVLIDVPDICLPVWSPRLGFYLLLMLLSLVKDRCHSDESVTVDTRVGMLQSVK